MAPRLAGAVRLSRPVPPAPPWRAGDAGVGAQTPVEVGMRYTVMVRHIAGYSSIDHVGAEFAGRIEQECAERSWSSRASALRGAWRVRVRVAQWLRENGNGVWRRDFFPAVEFTPVEVAP